MKPYKSWEFCESIKCPKMTLKEKTRIKHCEYCRVYQMLVYLRNHDQINEIKTRECIFCGKTFQPTHYHPNVNHCHSPECKRMYKIEQKGGIEAYRKWERERKQKRKNKGGEPD